MDTDNLIDDLEETLFPLGPFIGKKGTSPLPDIAAFSAAMTPVIGAILSGVLVSYGYDLIKPHIAKQGLLPQDELKPLVQKLCDHFLSQSPGPAMDVAVVRKSIEEALQTLQIPEQKIETVTNQILARLTRPK